MHQPPEPHFSFTIPSIHDDTALDCRIYHPQELSRRSSTSDSDSTARWSKKGIVMAHPYAPLGGSYDDRVVGIVADELLALGYIVGTFNFRSEISNPILIL
jgi:anaerobic glycerol-3-phosphate dehydrogenase